MNSWQRSWTYKRLDSESEQLKRTSLDSKIAFMACGSSHVLQFASQALNKDWNVPDQF